MEVREVEGVYSLNYRGFPRLVSVLVACVLRPVSGGTGGSRGDQASGVKGVIMVRRLESVSTHNLVLEK